MKTTEFTKLSVLMGSALITTTAVQASTDWGPAIYRPMSGCSKWYTSGNGFHFVVIHDMEGYYASTISYLNRCDITVSIHYMVNGLKDTSTDYPAGEIDQQVREAYYAWHACCWNTWMYGTEHEGFASNPAWYTAIMYANSSALQRHLCANTSIPKDRNHVIGHNEHNNASWRSWMASNYPSINTLCNSHTDPGVYWDWTKFMGYVAGTANAAQVSQSPADNTLETGGATFSFSITLTNNGAVPWICLGGDPADSLNFVSGTQMGWVNKNLAGDTVYPGETHTFTETLTAPTANGTYTLNLRMNSSDGVAYGSTFSLVIVVGAKVTAIVDDADAGFTFSGGWTLTTTGADQYGSGFHWRSTGYVLDATWTANLANTGTYNVYAWWTQGSNRTTTAPYSVNGGTAVNKNQQANGGVWNLLGAYSLTAGNNSVSVSANTTSGSIVVADAVKFVQQ